MHTSNRAPNLDRNKCQMLIRVFLEVIKEKRCKMSIAYNNNMFT